MPMERTEREVPSNDPAEAPASAGESWATMRTAACVLLLASLVGAALLFWWEFAFHPSNKQLWMVPVGLILLGTPIVVSLAIFTSDACRRFELLVKPAAPPASDVMK